MLPLVSLSASHTALTYRSRLLPVCAAAHACVQSVSFSRNARKHRWRGRSLLLHSRVKVFLCVHCRVNPLLPRHHHRTCGCSKDADLRGRGERYVERARGSRSLPVRLRQASLHRSQLMHTSQSWTLICGLSKQMKARHLEARQACTRPWEGLQSLLEAHCNHFTRSHATF